MCVLTTVNKVITTQIRIHSPVQTAKRYIMLQAIKPVGYNMYLMERNSRRFIVPPIVESEFFYNKLYGFSNYYIARALCIILIINTTLTLLRARTLPNTLLHVYSYYFQGTLKKLHSNRTGEFKSLNPHLNITRIIYCTQVLKVT